MAFAAFFTVSLGGLTIGLLFGIVTAIVTRWTQHVRGMFSISESFSVHLILMCVTQRKSPFPYFGLIYHQDLRTCHLARAQCRLAIIRSNY